MNEDRYSRKGVAAEPSGVDGAVGVPEARWFVAIVNSRHEKSVAEKLQTAGGMPYKIDRILEIAGRYGIPVIEDAAEGFGSMYRGQVLGTFGRYGVLSFNGNMMITTSGGGALVCPDADKAREILWYATQARESYPYYQHEAIGYNYRMLNICAGKAAAR